MRRIAYRFMSALSVDFHLVQVSNLNRQFLFRSHNVGQPKSVTAAAAARAMNPDLKGAWKPIVIVILL